MGISGKYGKVFISKIGEEEPIFILRAQDQLAVQAIEMYRKRSRHSATGAGRRGCPIDGPPQPRYR
ncbi:MAG: hypothetical protein AMJ94_06415 [Deltaproteobacteria bacterium SM23_61]|nr:MAG: hypothetical protein AMJ94_06415 [Deltaproteobacteria bacterium SM23_61]